MDKNKIYKYYKDIYTEKQMDEVLDGKEIAMVWRDKEKRVKKTGNYNKKEYKNNVLRSKEKKDEEL